MPRQTLEKLIDCLHGVHFHFLFYCSYMVAASSPVYVFEEFLLASTSTLHDILPKQLPVQLLCTIFFPSHCLLPT